MGGSISTVVIQDGRVAFAGQHWTNSLQHWLLDERLIKGSGLREWLSEFKDHSECEVSDVVPLGYGLVVCDTDSKVIHSCNGYSKWVNWLCSFTPDSFDGWITQEGRAGIIEYVDITPNKFTTRFVEATQEHPGWLDDRPKHSAGFNIDPWSIIVYRDTLEGYQEMLEDLGKISDRFADVSIKAGWDKFLAEGEY